MFSGGLRDNFVLLPTNFEEEFMRKTVQNRRPTTSTTLAIGMLDISKPKVEREWVTIPVRSHFNDTEVTKKMVEDQVGALNENSGLHGKTCRPTKKVLVYRVQTLQ